KTVSLPLLMACTQQVCILACLSHLHSWKNRLKSLVLNRLLYSVVYSYLFRLLSSRFGMRYGSGLCYVSPLVLAIICCTLARIHGSLQHRIKRTEEEISPTMDCSSGWDLR